VSHPAPKHCTVVYATSARQYSWRVTVPPQASVGEVLAAARSMAGALEEVPWDAADVGIFGEPCDRGAIPADGDRIEIYRPLNVDPKESRRERVRRARAAARSGR
jgi:uncharacterized protein